MTDLLTDLVLAVFSHPWALILCVVLEIAARVAIVWIRTGHLITLLQARLEDRNTSLRIALTDLGRVQQELAALRIRARDAGLPVSAPAENVTRRKR